MEDDQAATEALQEPAEIAQEPRVKRPRTEAQMLALSRAREQAMAVRQQNAELRRKQAEIDRAHVAKTKREENERIEREFAALSQPPPSPPSPEDPPRAPPEEAPRRKRKPARRVVVTEASSASESEDEVEVTLPRARKAPTREEVLYQRTMAKMFEVA